MYDTLIKLIELLAPWPVIQIMAALLIGYVGLRAIQRGEKDKKPNGNGNGDATPRWFTNEQTRDLLREILSVLREINKESREQSQLLENIANENVINPRRLQE